MEGLEKELSQLRRGRGVMSADLRERLGPTLRTLARIDSEASLLDARRQLIGFLDELAADLPDDLRTAFAAALALRREVQHRFLEERMQWLADWLERDVKTARRRAGEAIRQAAEHVNVTSEDMDRYPHGDWYLAKLRTILRPDVVQPSAVEERIVVATRADLAEIVLSTSIPRPGLNHGEQVADVAVLHGGTLTKAEWSTPSYLTYTIRLDRPLCHGDSCELGVRIAIPPGQPFNPRYSFQPLRRCDEFDLRIRFGESADARRVWQISGLPRGMIEDFAAPEALIVPDTAGDIHLNFKFLKVGLVYGARWTD